MSREGVEIIVCYARCWSCMFDDCPGGWHTWADAEDIEHAASISKPDPSTSKCGCVCTSRPANDPEEADLDVVVVSLDAEPCPACGASGACSWDANGRPLIHTTEETNRDD